MKPDRTTAGLIMILIVAAGLRIWGLEHGLPHNLIPDTTVVRAALSLGSGSNPFAGEQLETQYPYFLPYLLFVVYGSMFLGGAAAGIFSDVAAFGEFAFQRPDIFFLVARGVVAFAGLLMVLLVFACGRRIAGSSAGLAAAGFTATSLLLVQLSHQARPHVVCSTLIVFCLWFGLRSLERWRPTDLIAVWIISAAAGSTVPYGFMSVVIPVALTARALAEDRRRWLSAAVGLVLFTATVLLCFPAILMPSSATFGADAETGVVRYFGGLKMRPELINGKGFFQLGRWLMLSEPILALLSMVAIGTVLGCRQEFKKWWLAALFPTIFILVYGSYEVIHARYLVPLIPFLSLVSGWLVATWVSRIQQRWRTGRLLTTALIVTVFALPVAQATRLDLLLSRSDTRLQAEQWINDNLAITDLLAFESHGVSLKPDRASLERMAEMFPEQMGTRDRQRLRTTDHSGGRSVCRLWNHPAREELDIGDVIANHDVRFVAATLLGDKPRNDRLYASLIRDGSLITTISPLVRSSTTAQCRLPLELDNPLLGLWQVERCGPVIEIFEISKR